MKKIAVFFLFIIFAAYCLYAQNTSTGYYLHDGVRKEIPINNQHLLTYFRKALISFEEINSIYSIDKEVMLNESKADSLYAFVIEIDNNNYKAAIATLKSRQYVYDVEPVIGEHGNTPVSNKFYVQLYSLADTIVLKNMATQTGATYEGAIIKDCEHDFYWYSISTNKSTNNALEMSVIFGESGLFKAVDPGVIHPMRYHTSNRSNSPGPNDNLISDQWAITDLYDIWAEGIRGNGVKIALIDDGVDTNHYEFDSLNSISVDYYNYFNSPAEIYGPQGTNIAGVIFSDHGNGDIAGIAPKASLINISFWGNQTQQDPIILQEYDVFSLVSCFSYALTAAGADIILCPWEYIDYDYIYGNHSTDNLLISMLEYISINGRNGKGAIIIFSSGNEFNGSDAIKYPASLYDNAFVVGATNIYHERTNNSCYGDALDIVAPGDEILTTGRYNNIVSVSGTGIAAAHVAGVVALMLSANPNLKRSQVDWILKHTTYKSTDYTFSTYSGHPDGTWNSELGYGEIQSAKAIELAKYFSTSPNLVVKDISTDDGTEPSPYSSPLSSPSIVAKDATNTNTVTEIWLDNSYKINVTLHNYSTSDVIVNPSDVKLYSKIYKNGTLTWNSSFPYNSPHTPTSTTPVTISGNGGSHTFIIPITTPSQLPNGLSGTGLHIAFVVVIGNNQYEIHNYSDATIPIDNFIAENRLVAGKQYNFYTEWDTPIFPFTSPTITPNPTNGQATIEVDWDEIPADAMIVVTDIYGNTILFDRFIASSYRLNLDGRASGTYYVYIVSEGKALCINKIVVY